MHLLDDDVNEALRAAKSSGVNSERAVSICSSPPENLTLYLEDLSSFTMSSIVPLLALESHCTPHNGVADFELERHIQEKISQWEKGIAEH